MVTLKDVAKKANVSKMTVSRVINHPELVTDELKQLVHDAMQELGYKPNPVARALAQNRTMIVKVLILEEMDSTEPYFMHLIHGIASELDEHHYALQLVTENTFDQGGCDGYIISGMTRQDYDWVKELKLPLVIFGENDINLPFVDTKNEEAVYKITQLAQEKGYCHFVYIGMDVPELFAQSRLKGFLEAMKTRPELTFEKFKVRNSSTAAEQLVKSFYVSENTCFICSTDRIALGVQRALKQYQPPLDNYGITGFDGVFLDRIASPKLTTVKQDVANMGRACVSLLMDLIDGKQLKRVDNFFEPIIVERETL